MFLCRQELEGDRPTSGGGGRGGLHPQVVEEIPAITTVEI